MILDLPFKLCTIKQPRYQAKSRSRDPTVPYLPKRWSHSHVLSRNSIRVQYFADEGFPGLQIRNFSGLFAPMTQFIQLSDPGKLVFCVGVSIQRRLSPTMSKWTFSPKCPLKTCGQKSTFCCDRESLRGQIIPSMPGRGHRRDNMTDIQGTTWLRRHFRSESDRDTGIMFVATPLCHYGITYHRCYGSVYSENVFVVRCVEWVAVLFCINLDA